MNNKSTTTNQKKNTQKALSSISENPERNTQVFVKSLHEKWKKYIEKGPEVDSAKLIRQMRDN